MRRRSSIRRGRGASPVRGITALALASAAGALAMVSCANVLGIDGDYFEDPAMTTTTGTPTGTGGTSTGTGQGGGTPTGTGTGQGGASSCTDGQHNGAETDVDCGGSCPPCALGQGCLAPGDCVGDYCVDDVCCESECAGLCQACSDTMTDESSGTCSPVTAGTDPDAECTDTDFCSAGQCVACGVAAPATGTICPGECTGGCNGSQCVITCGGSPPDCQGTNITCPAGFDCLVQCTVADGCRNATVACPADHGCRVECLGGVTVCRDFTMQCSAAGTCELACGVDTQACQAAALNCGFNACTATCESGSHLPVVTCGAACSCTSC